MTLGIRVLVGMLGLLTVLSGCAGYRVGNISGRELQGVRSVFVPTVKNETIEPGLPVMVSNEIIRRFDNDGTLETLQSAQADSELDVTIKRMERRPVRGNRRNNSLWWRKRPSSIASSAEKFLKARKSAAGPNTSCKTTCRKWNGRPCPSQPKTSPTRSFRW
jgi:hypothetical protein